MKCLIDKNALSSIVNNMQSVVSLRPPMPILNNILIEAKDSHITITGTDLAIGIRSSTPANVIEAGQTTLPARHFAQLLKEINASYIELTTRENNISELVADSSNFRLRGMAKGDFPSLPDLQDSIQVTASQKQLKNALLRTVFAVATDDMRYFLTGIYLQVSEEAALCVGTDGKRLARILIPVQGKGRVSYSCIIPSKGVVELSKILQENDSPATLYLLPDKIAVATPDSLVVTKLLSGEYPDVERIIPSSFSSVFPIQREELMALLRQVSLFAKEENSSARCTLENGMLHLSANTVDVGEGRVSMPIQYEGEKLDIAFNPFFFLDILRHSQGEYMYLGVQDAFNPLAISDTPFNTQIEQFPPSLFILMPLRLK